MSRKKKEKTFDIDIPVEKQSEKQKWNHMNGKQKVQYIVDYYLVKGLILVAGLIGILFLIWSFFKPREENLLYVAVIDKEMNETQKEYLKNKMRDIYGIDEGQIQIDDSFFLASQGQQKLEVYLYNKQIDVIIASEDIFEQYAAFGFFDDITNGLSDAQQKKYKERYRYAAGYEEEDEVSFEDNEIGEGEKLPYGIMFMSEEKENGQHLQLDGYVFSIALNAPHKENAVKFLDCIMDK